MAKESEIIDGIRKRARLAKDILVGIGDDAAVMEHDGATDLLACSDLSVEGVHFRLNWMTPQLVGRKALAVTLSDVAAMGGRARFALVSLAIPHSANPSLAEDVMQGIFDMADASGVALIGGDTSSSPDHLFVDTIAIGECRKGAAIQRRGASAGEKIFVTGSLGASALGLALLERGHRLDTETGDGYGRERLIQEALRKHLRPEPRLAFGQVIGERRLATAMIDISDGLSTDLWHILAESQCGAVLAGETIPIADCVTSLAAEDATIHPFHLALHGGEEYELLFMAKAEKEQEIMAAAASLHITVTSIGRLVEGRHALLEGPAGRQPIAPGGYEHTL